MPKYDPATINLVSHTYSRNARWQIDMDYVQSLDAETKAWLSKFCHEYYKAGVKKNDLTALHPEHLRKDCYNRSNISRRDLYSILDSHRGILSLKDEERDSNESTYIQSLD